MKFRDLGIWRFGDLEIWKFFRNSVIPKFLNPKIPKSPNPRAERGQAVVFMLFALTVLAFMLLWKVDLHSIVTTKDRTQTAGDTAALAGARWQASALNLIGELNLLHALAIEAQDEAAQDMITNMQVRLCFAGPMVGVLAMQQAAKLNRIHVNPEFTEYMKEHAQTVRDEYGLDIGGSVLLEEPWPGAWEEYADMIDMVADEGIAAGIDNHKRYDDPADGHILADKGFYRAVDARDWCWFFLYHEGLLESYTGYHDWPPLPPPDPPIPQDCEYLALRLAMVPIQLMETTVSQLKQQADTLDYEPFPTIMTQVTENVHNWMIYQPWVWNEWGAINEPDFPILGTVKPEFDYAGADVVSRVHTRATRLTPNLDNTEQTDEIVWSAAAKPFGYLTPDKDDDDNRLKPSGYGLVLPAFRAVRLIPVDTASAGSPGGFDLLFRKHINEHLPVYLSTGTREPGCRYCRSLGIFDIAEFRQQGVDWLRDNSGLCTLPPPSSGGRGGGTQRGH